MVKQFKIFIISLFFTLLCLKLSHAQTNSNPVNVTPAANSIQTPAVANPNEGAPEPTPANTPAPPAIPSVPNAAPPTTAPATATTPAAAAPASKAPTVINMNNMSTLTNQGPPTSDPLTGFGQGYVPGKYAEFLSICRNHDFDKLQFQKLETYQARVAELKNQAEQFIQNYDEKNIEQAFNVMAELIDLYENSILSSLTAFLNKKPLKAFNKTIFNGLVFYSQRNYRDARTNLLKANAEDNKNVFVLKILAQVYRYEGNFFESSAIYEDLNKENNNNYLAELCENFVLNSLNADGEKICRQAIKKFPDNPFPWLYAGITHRERQNLKLAKRYFLKANSVRPTEMGNICLAELSLIDSNYNEAITYFKESVNVSPKSSRAVLGLAWTQMNAKDFTGALSTFKKACELNRSYETEVRKAYKKLVEEKSAEAEKFMKLALSCSI